MILWFYDVNFNYYSMFSKAKSKTKIGAAKEQEAAGFKILTPKQILQRLPIALALVNFILNNSENSEN